MTELTDAQIDAMPAGREMDAEVGRLVMGLDIADLLWPCGQMPDCGGYEAYWRDPENDEIPSWYNERGPVYLPEGGVSYEPVPFYSEDIAAAWQVVTHFNRTHHWRICSPFTPGEPWVAGFTPHGTTGWNGVPDVQAAGETAELAISRAALKATLRSKEAGR